MLRPTFISLIMFAYVVLLPGAAAARRSWSTLQAAAPLSTAQTEQLPKGQMTERVVCAAAAAQSYALYLPSNYTATRKWPILYAFDPGARGKIPVERFKEAAEKYGWIVVGSNNSRNGPLQSSVDAFNAMRNDARARFSIDEDRAYTTGMSGGARVAVMIAHLCRDCIAGVIGCGAGFPNGVPPAPAMRFVYFGAVGVDDPNFPELRTLDDALSKAGMPHSVRVFAGRHEWAPSPIATEAVEWMELQAMKTGRRQRDDNLINELWQKYSASAMAFESANKPYEACQVLVGLVDNFKGLHDISEAEKHASQMSDSRAVKEALREERQQISRQREKEQQIYSLIAASTGDEAFDSARRLRTAIAELQQSSKTETDSGERRVARRVTEGLFIGLIEQGRDLLQQKNYLEAASKLEVAVEVAPDRPGGFFYLAQAYALKGNKKKSLQALQKAIDKGFSDLAAVTENKAFDSLRNESQYLQIVQSLKSAH